MRCKKCGKLHLLDEETGKIIKSCEKKITSKIDEYKDLKDSIDSLNRANYFLQQSLMDLAKQICELQVRIRQLDKAITTHVKQVKAHGEYD